MVTYDKNWKTEFFFISGFWSGHPVEVGRDTFTPYTGELGNLRPEGMFMFCFIVLSVFIFCLQSSNLIFFFLSLSLFLAVGCPSLSKFHCDRVHRARLHADRSFYSLVTLQRLATWKLGPKSSIEAFAHKLTVRRRESPFFYVYLEISQVLFYLYFLTNILCFSFRDGNYEGE